MDDVQFMHKKTREVVSARSVGRKEYKKAFEDRIQRGEIAQGAPFVPPSTDDMIVRGLASLDNNEDYERIV